MKIGIDIDDTLTDIKDKLTNAATEYANSINKNACNKPLKISDVYNNGNIYQKIFNFSYEELKYFLGTIQEEITNSATPRDYCVDVIKKLHNDGNKIYIITARDSEFHEDPYLQSETWLKENNIYFDQLIINARDKKKVCLENEIDLLIDDNISNCLSVSNIGIPALTIGNDNRDSNTIKKFQNWNQIYEFITKSKIFKIVTYDEKYKREVCDFVNESMHKFIGRDYKERPDVLNINDYYIKSKGNFWLAIDIKTKKIIGTIALENRNDNHGILKRFYVDKDYQNIGVGSKLYEIFSSYVEKETKINKIYLACGSVLKNAHQFYKRKGFIQIKHIDIDMHFVDDDDFFVKVIDRDKIFN